MWLPSLNSQNIDGVARSIPAVLLNLTLSQPRGHSRILEIRCAMGQGQFLLGAGTTPVLRLKGMGRDFSSQTVVELLTWPAWSVVAVLVIWRYHNDT